MAKTLAKAVTKKWHIEHNGTSDNTALRDKATVAALTVLSVFRTLKISLQDTKSINILTRALLVRVDKVKKECPDFTLVDSIFPGKRYFFILFLVSNFESCMVHSLRLFFTPLI